MDIFVHDLVQMRKKHPCGTDRFWVIRTGADIKIKCTQCGRIIMLERPVFEKRMKKLLLREAETQDKEGNAKGKDEEE